ncbi:MAG TPA: ABC transporter permease [Lachnospiraceae bacterium]|nr:ABC transporter permease [Lachnospiraceae bacterium]
MEIFKHEIRQGRMALFVWTAAISFMIGICIMIYPEISSQMGEVSNMFAGMGSFSQAFGMDKINFGEFTGFFSVECGNVLGLGGAFFAAIIGISALAKEEKEHTAEFLLAHPVSRAEIISGKLFAIAAQIVILNVAVIAVTVLSVIAIGEDVPVKTFAMLFFAYFMMQFETAAVTFGISAFLSHNSFGAGIAIAAVFYFLNIVANLTEQAEILKYITPFGYTEGADIIMDNAINGRYLAAGIIFTVAGTVISFWKYQRKDIL